jgi:hypothetical protein
MYDKLTSFQEKAFNITIVITYALIIITALGLSSKAPQYLKTFDYYVKIYVCLFLVWRFNPFRKLHTFTSLDKKIAFSAGLFILTTNYLQVFLNEFSGKMPTISDIKRVF